MRLLPWRLVTGALLLLPTACAPSFTGRVDAFEMRSDAAGGAFQIHVYLPPQHGSSSSPLPVLYQLDGPSQAAAVAGYAEEGGYEVVVVGVGYPAGEGRRRFLDYTPSADARYGPDTGGARAFLAFLRDELIPRIESDYRVQSADRALMGHSLGGLASVSILLSQDRDAPVFERVAAASPSLWWDSGLALQLEREHAAMGSALPARVFLSSGGLESPDIILYTDALAERLERRDGLSLALAIYPDTAHSQSWEHAYPDALEHFYGR